ncbi:hypothetical protein OHB05_42590 [Streptomyces sp. NBC_00638]|uniref:hypothetical protein n=2 Tax=unclassified Streptomyces TaxID=2593676 RepID=UPI00224D9383|nr:hypothetical protein [Streptomyces sp. NBC_00638]MCX5009207.1 hypothetical protein [Streptomyces sp. NBC_00638]
MAWDWVGTTAAGLFGVAGTAFTWLAGAQGRRHAERMLARTQQAERRARLWQERREAYFGALRVIDLDLRRERYKELGQLQKLQEVEGHWTKVRRVELTTEAATALWAFGSDTVRDLAARWITASDADNVAEMRQIALEFRAAVRRELQDPTQG